MKEVPSPGDTIHGRFLPAGTRIAPSNWALMRKMDVFGQDAELFRPERWLEVEGAQATNMRRHVELVFGYGRWACAGKSIAFLELNKIFVEVCYMMPDIIRLDSWGDCADIEKLLRRFDFQLVNPTRPWSSINHNLFLQKNMWVHVTERKI
jgi:hypothetical protein